MVACHQCRVVKRKCIRDQAGPLACCNRCVRRDLACSLAQTNSAGKRKLAVRPDSQSPSPNGTPLEHPPRSEVDDFLADTNAIAELVQNYVTKIHGRPHSIFHPASLWGDIRDQRISRALLLAVCAMGARLSTRPEVRSLEPLLTADSKQLLQADLENVCLENIQTCILLANLCAAHANPSSEVIFFRMAVAMVELMQTFSLYPTNNAITHELSIRIWWALFMADNWYPSSLGLPRQMKNCPRPARLPVDDGFFAALTPDQPLSVLDSCSTTGLWGYMVTLVELFAPIQELNWRVVQDKNLKQPDINHDTETLAQELEAWEAGLPRNIQLNELNLMDHVSNGTGGSFLALHLGYHHYATLLYYQYLDTRFSQTSQSRKFTARCKYHALGYSTLLARGRELPGCEAVYPTVGHMTIVSSSALLHTLLFGEEAELTQARHGLRTNFEALLELEQYWPVLKIMINRLMNFQNTCLLSSHHHTHRLDRWMVRFLFEYALPLSDKMVEEQSIAEREIISTQAQFFSEQGRLTTFGNG